MINSDSPYNLVSQDIVRRFRLCGDTVNLPPARDLNGGGIRLYQQHRVAIKAVGDDCTATLDATYVFGANITGCELILGMAWLSRAEPEIKWLKGTVSFKDNRFNPLTKEAASIRAQAIGRYNVSTTPHQSSTLGSPNSIPAVTCAIATLGELAKICTTKGSCPYLVQWRDLEDPADKLSTGVLVGAVSESVFAGAKEAVKCVTLQAQ